jgi:iron complex outermembrane receptor protein
VAWDRLFVLDGGAPATRHVRQAQATWRHAFDSGAEVHASLGRARVKRDETLIGYWTLVSPETVSSYYTQYQDRYRQRSGRLEFRLPLKVAGWRHDARLGVDGYRQHFLFEGVQHIGALTTSVAAPDFRALDPASLDLWPRYNEERIDEEAAWVADRARVSDRLEVAVAVRRQRYTIDADRAGTGLTRAAAAAETTWFAGADWRFADRWRGWASRAAGMEPNRGATTSGEFLLPQVSRQSELGVAWREAGLRVSGALWRITLDNVAMTNPADRTAVIAAGSRQVEGLELSAAWQRAQWKATAHATLQRSRHRVKTSPSLGERFVGVPKAVGGLQIQGPVPLPAGLIGRLAVSLTAVGSRMGNAANTVQVPGYVRIDGSLAIPHDKRQWFVGVRNLGDIRYVESVTAVDDVFQGARRQWWLGVRLDV